MTLVHLPGMCIVRPIADATLSGSCAVACPWAARRAEPLHGTTASGAFSDQVLHRLQGVALQPIGDAGVLVAATDTVRGFSALDQAWLAAIADKLDATLEGAGEDSGDRPAPVVAAAAGETSH